MNLSTEVTLREVSPRDGFQSIKDFIPTEKKLQIIEAVKAAGVSEIESTSFVSPKAVPQLRDAGEFMAFVPRNRIVHAALVPNLKGAQNAIVAGVNKLVVVISASEAHNQENVRRTIEASISDLDAIFELARGEIEVIGSVAVAFGCPYQGDVPENDVFKIVEAYISRGASSIIMADTTGMATPDRVATVHSIREQVYLNAQDRDHFIQLLLEKNQVKSFETQFKRKDGSVIWVLVSGRFAAANGQEPFLEGFCIDITEKKSAEEALRRERDIFSRVMETSPVGITLVDTKGRITFANPRAEKILDLVKGGNGR